MSSLEDFRKRINTFRDKSDSVEKRSIIGCIILTNPIFFDEIDWLSTPPDWQTSIVSGKSYNSVDGYGKILWERIEKLFYQYKLYDIPPEKKSQLAIAEDSLAERYGSEILTRVRLGQGAFRIMVTDAYERRCAVSGERTLPALDAAHIKPYDRSGPHLISNGMLLRSDIHRLYDKGYITITTDYRVFVSRKIKEEYENGREYYRYHGNRLVSCPSREIDKPSKEFIEWHNREIFKS